LGLNALIQGSKVVKLSSYYIGPKMMFGSVPEHIANLRDNKRCKSCVSGMNALFRGTELEWHPFYYIGTKMMFGSVFGAFR
jgi:hypothetical protein